LFERGQGRITGDITPAYSILAERRIHHARSLMPDAKIIFLMRNPVERTWSQSVQFFDRRGIKVQSLSESRLRDFFSLKGVRLRSSYLNILKNWQKFYPEEQFFVGFLEDIHLYPGHLLRRLYRFLGASDSADYRITRDKIFSRGTQALPTRLAAHLAQAYHEDLRMLEERFGGYVSFWLYCAERLINDPPAEEYIPYPLWESSLWEEWVSSSGESPVVGSRLAKLQSGPLPSITTTSGGGRA
jgi:Sulfotransferase family